MEFPNQCYSGMTADGKMILTPWYRAQLAACEAQASASDSKIFRCACDAPAIATDADADAEDPRDAFYRELQKRYDKARGSGKHVEIPPQLGDLRDNASRTEAYGRRALLEPLQARADARLRGEK